MKDTDLDTLLRKALTPTIEPEEKLNQSILNHAQERNLMKRKYEKRVSTGLLAAVLLLALTISAYAASEFINSNQVAEHMGDQLLAEAFESQAAFQFNQSVVSNAYIFTLHGLVSGEGLSSFPHSSEEIYPDRTYAVVSIKRQDGNPMPHSSDPEYNNDSFFVSPLIKGQKPWLVNILTMNGAYSEIVIDGVLYRMIECDQVEMFADRGVYLAISSGTAFYSNEAFMYNEKTGEIQVREDYPHASALFELPLDAAKADYYKAETYLKSLSNPPPSPETGNNAVSNDAEVWNWIEIIKAKIREGASIGDTLAGSVKEVDYDASGNIIYEYDGWNVTMSLDDFFVEGQTGFSDRISISGDGESYKARLFHRDYYGIVTGRIVILDKLLHPPDPN